MDYSPHIIVVFILYCCPKLARDILLTSSLITSASFLSPLFSPCLIHSSNCHIRPGKNFPGDLFFIISLHILASPSFVNICLCSPDAVIIFPHMKTQSPKHKIQTSAAILLCILIPDILFLKGFLNYFQSHISAPFQIVSNRTHK